MYSRILKMIELIKISSSTWVPCHVSTRRRYLAVCVYHDLAVCVYHVARTLTTTGPILYTMLLILWTYVYIYTLHHPSSLSPFIVCHHVVIHDFLVEWTDRQSCWANWCRLTLKQIRMLEDAKRQPFECPSCLRIALALLGILSVRTKLASPFLPLTSCLYILWTLQTTLR